MIAISDEIRDGVAGVKVGYALIEGVDVSKENPDLETVKRRVEGEIQQKYSDASANDVPEIVAWRNVYSSFGYKPSKKRNTMEALIRRIVRDEGFPTVNTVVDSYNIAIVRQMNPMGAYDADKLDGEIVLRYSTEGENYQDIGCETGKMREGVIVYSDDTGIICRGYNYKDAERTKITPDTKKVVLIADGTDQYSIEDVERALDDAIGLITKFCGGKVVEKKIIS